MGQETVDGSLATATRVPCTICAAGPGEPCRNKSGRSRWSTHRERVEAFRAVQHLDARQIALRFMPYSEYLETPEWKALRAMKLRDAEWRCQVCNAADRQLNVHHRTYDRRGAEHLSDLTVLCRPCHALFHRKAA